MHELTHILTSLILNLLTSAVSGERALLDQHSPAKPPVRADAHGLSVAIVFPSKDTAQLLVLRDEAHEAQSAVFAFPSVATFGAAWVEQIEVKSSSSFIARIRTRQTCGPGVYDYSFVQQSNRWIVSSLEREESACSDDGIVRAWKKSYDFIGNRVISVTFRNGIPRESVTRLNKFTQFSLVKFQALDTRYEK